MQISMQIAEIEKVSYAKHWACDNQCQESGYRQGPDPIHFDLHLVISCHVVLRVFVEGWGLQTEALAPAFATPKKNIPKSCCRIRIQWNDPSALLNKFANILQFCSSCSFPDLRCGQQKACSDARRREVAHLKNREVSSTNETRKKAKDTESQRMIQTNDSNDTDTESELILKVKRHWASKDISEAIAPPRQKLLSCSLEDFLVKLEIAGEVRSNKSKTGYIRVKKRSRSKC